MTSKLDTGRKLTRDEVRIIVNMVLDDRNPMTGLDITTAQVMKHLRFPYGDWQSMQERIRKAVFKFEKPFWDKWGAQERPDFHDPTRIRL